MTTANRPSDIIALAASAGFAGLVLYLLIVGQGILMPLVLAVFLAYLIVASSHAIQRLKFGTWQAPGWLALTTAIAAFIVLIAGLVQVIAENVGAVAATAPQYQARLESLFERLNTFMASTFGAKPLTMTTILNSVDLKLVLGEVAAAFQSIAGNTLQILVYVVFLLLEYRTLDIKMKALFPVASREGAVRRTMTKIGARIEAYVLIKTFISFMTGLASYVVLIVAGIDFAAFWALLIFVLNFIPYVGGPIGMAFPALLALLQFESPATAAIVLACLAGVQAVVGNVIEPKLLGNSLNLSPVFMIVSLSVWGVLWGVTGMILAVPIMVMLMITFAQFEGTRPIAILMSESGNPD